MSNENEYDRVVQHGVRLSEEEQFLWKEYAKILLTFSGGAVALSVTLVSGVLGPKLINYFEILFRAWFFFTVCIVLTMISFKTNQIAYRKEIDLLYKEYSDKGEASEKEYRGFWIIITEILVILSTVGFLIGLFLLLKFVAKNISA